MIGSMMGSKSKGCPHAVKVGGEHLVLENCFDYSLLESVAT